MGLHINRSYINNEKYRDTVKSELHAFKKLIESVAALKWTTDDLDANKDKLQAIYDLSCGKTDSAKYDSGKGWSYNIKFNAIKADKVNLSKMNVEQLQDFLKTFQNDLQNIAISAGVIKEDDVEGSFVDEFKGAWLKSTSGLVNSVDKSTDFTNEEIYDRQNLINSPKFGDDYLSVDAEEKDLNIDLSGNLTDRIKSRLEAKKISDWENILSQEMIKDSVDFYKENIAKRYISDSKFIIGKVIYESNKGKDITENNIQQILRDVKETSDTYKQINGFRRFLSYINPGKDSVRDLRKEITDAKQFLQMKGIDNKQLDSFLDNKREISNVKAPTSRHYLETVKNAKEVFEELKNVENNKIFSKNTRAEYVMLGDVITTLDGKEVNIEDSRAHIEDIMTGKGDKWPIDEKVINDDLNDVSKIETEIDQPIQPTNKLMDIDDLEV